MTHTACHPLGGGVESDDASMSGQGCMNVIVGTVMLYRFVLPMTGRDRDTLTRVPDEEHAEFVEGKVLPALC